MASTCIDCLGGATLGLGPFLVNGSGTAAVASDFTHGGNPRSIKFRPGQGDSFTAGGGSVAVLGDTGTRLNIWIYLAALPTATAGIIALEKSSSGVTAASIRITSGGVVQIWSGKTGNSQLGSNGPTLSTGKWYRVALAYTVTSTTVNRYELRVSDDNLTAVGSISLTNVTILTTLANRLEVGNLATDTTLDFRASELYVDTSNSLTDPGSILVTAKRPFANGTTNGFTTQVGSGGSSYGTGHAQQVNERPNSDSNGWSMVGAGSAVTEEYTIEGASVGDTDISADTLVDFMGWVRAKSLAGETGQLILAGANTSISLTSSIKYFSAFAGSTTYPAGGTDIGLQTDTSLTTVSLYECGVMVAFVPGTATSSIATSYLRRRNGEYQ